MELCASALNERRKLCSLGSGEIVHIISYKALEEKVEEFETIVQDMARLMYSLESSITDVRVCHPQCGEVCFVLTFITREAMEKFREGPQVSAEQRLAGLITTEGGPQFTTSGCLMPAAHTLASLLEYLKVNITGYHHSAHNVKLVQKELEKWYPRPSEYRTYVKLDENDSKKYTRNLVFGNEFMDVILMCWPAGSMSTIHDHDVSSCWVVVVEGVVHEVQYASPLLDRKFLEAEKVDPHTATGNCGILKVIGESRLDTGGVTSSYANNDIGLHRVENRSDKLACTLHVYAPPLRKMRIYKESGHVNVYVASASSCKSGQRCDVPPIFCVDSWNSSHSDIK